MTKPIADLIESASLNLDRAKDDKVCQVAEMHLIMAQTEALIAIAQLLRRDFEYRQALIDAGPDRDQVIAFWGTGNVQQP